MKFFENLRFITFTAVAAMAWAAYGAVPAGYYSSCENKGGASLLTSLRQATSAGFNSVSYDGLWNLFKSTDIHPEDGKIWDMYSTKHWTPGGEQCGNYKTIGDCYNREHSFPKSWFSKAKPMYSDAFHLYPTDGWVNSKRSNLPFGECSGGEVGSKNGVKGLGKVASSTFPGYSGQVFEPDDEYKGDFARSYFYMAARYNDRIASWSSDMLANNSYPAFKTWAVELLLKWHRQDPVSKKELDRQEAVYAKQGNRNPFIDYPDMVEYIWGNKKDQSWTSSASAPDPVINRPVDGSSLNMGVTAPNVSVSRQVSVLTTGMTSAVTISATGAGFSVSPASLSASAANAGADVTVTFRPSTTGTFTGTLVVSAGGLKSTVALSAKSTGGVPLNEAEEVTAESFVASWVYVGDDDADGNYTLDVADDDGSIDGYPRKVNARAGRYTVTGLTPSNEYRYIITSQNYTSVHMDVRTADAVPSIDFLFDGDLYFATIPGEPSEAAEILISTDYVDSDFTVSVLTPFEISVDHSNWSTSLTLSPDENRLYMRLNSAAAGNFDTDITAVWGKYEFDEAHAAGVASEQKTFFEDFEPEYDGSDAGSYTTKHYNGSACAWTLYETIIGTTNQDPAHGGKQCLRLGKNGGGIAQMDADRDRGIGELSFFARVFGSDEACKIAVEYSTDGGETWENAGDVTVSDKTYREFKVRVGAIGKVRARLRQLSGKRWLLDDVSLTDNATGVDDPMAERHTWDAYSHGGSLYVNVEAPEGALAGIYALDGTTLHYGVLGEGLHSFDALTPGTFYIVVVGDFSRTVLIR
ncbi:MAG: endonuclease [Muribaculaceae bacterium]|nr:endonuclease [Muribaculaceae bacterium]